MEILSYLFLVSRKFYVVVLVAFLYEGKLFFYTPILSPLAIEVRILENSTLKESHVFFSFFSFSSSLLLWLFCSASASLLYLYNI